MATRTNKIFILLFSLLVSLNSAGVFAQDKTADCTVTREAIENLLTPNLSTYSLWDLFDGTSGIEQSFHDFIIPGEDEVILGGVQKNELMMRPYITKINRRGKTLWTWMDKDEKGNYRPISIEEMIEYGDFFLAVGQLYNTGKPYGIWIGRFNSETGNLLGEQVISQSGKNLTFGGMTRALDGKGWLLGVTEQRRSKEPTLNQPFSGFYLLGQDFKLVKSRSFVPGPENRLWQIQRFEDENEPYYVAIGEIDDGYDRAAGLVIRLDKFANIVWQRTYPRGGGTRFKDVAQSPDGGILILGDVQPIDTESPAAAIAMKLSSANGDEIWQRYYRREDVSYFGKSLFAAKNGRIYMLLYGTNPLNQDLQEHATLIITTPRGQREAQISYTVGVNSIPYKLKNGFEGVITLAGQATMKDPDPSDPQNAEKFILTKKGWFLVGEPLGNYKDPCISQEKPF